MINAKFIAGMLAMALAFGMTGCPQGTNTVTKTITVPGGQTTIPGKDVPGPLFAANEATLAGYLDKTDKRTDPIYVVSDVEVVGNLIVPEGKSIVVTDDEAIRAKAVTAGALSQNRGALFAIGSLGDYAPVLTVKGRLTVQDGGKVVLGSTNPAETDRSGKLLIADTGKVLVTKGASVTTTTSSQIELATASSTLVFEDTAAKLEVVGTLTSSETVVGNSDGSALIIVPSTGNPSLVIKPANVPGATLGNFTPAAASTSTSTEASAALTAGSTSVFYSGETSLGAVEVKSGSALIITGNLEQKDKLTVTGTLEIAPGAEVTIGASGTLAVEAGAEVAIPEGAKLTVASGGSVDLNALFTPSQTGGTSKGKVELEGELEVEKGGTLRLSMGNGSDLPPEIDWTAGGSVTIANGGSLTLAAGADVPYIAAKDTAGALYTWDDADGTGYITLEEGKMEFSGKITAANSGGSIGESITVTIAGGSEFTVGTTYPIEGTLKVPVGAKVIVPIHTGGTNNDLYIYESGTLDLDGTLVLGEGNLCGQLVLRAGGTLNVAATGTIIGSDTNNETAVLLRVDKVEITNGVVGAPTQGTKSSADSSGNNLIVTTESSTGRAWSKILGKYKITGLGENDGFVEGAPAGTDAAAGSIKAGTDTWLVFNAWKAEPDSATVALSE
jgi:hypothetical protein